MKLTLLSAAMAAFVLTCAGCSSDPKEEAKKKIVGVWNAEQKLDENVTVEGKSTLTMKFDFKDDGTLKWDTPFFPLPGTWQVKGVDGDTVTLDIELEMPKGKDESKKEKKEFKLVFESDDKATLTDPNDKNDKPLTLTRQAS